MEIEIWIDGKLDRKHQLKQKAKKLAWRTFVYLDCVYRNKRLLYTANEKAAMCEAALCFARGARRPY